MKRWTLTILLIIPLSIFSQSSNHVYFKLSKKYFDRAEYAEADKSIQKFVETVQRNVKYSNYYDSVGFWCFYWAEQFQQKGQIDYSNQWYLKCTQYNGRSHKNWNDQGYFEFLFRTGYSFYMLSDYEKAKEKLEDAYLNNKNDSILLDRLATTYYKLGYFNDAIEICNQLKLLFKNEHPLVFNIKQSFADYKSANQQKLSKFKFDTETVFYVKDRRRLYAYNLRDFNHVQVFYNDSIHQYIERIVQQGDSLLISCNGPWGHIERFKANIPENFYYDGFGVTSVDFTYIHKVDLKTGNKFHYQTNILKEYSYHTGDIDTNWQVIDHFYGPSGDLLYSTDSLLDIDEWNYIRNGDWSPFCYFCFRFETPEYKNRKIVADTAGLWLFESGKKEWIKPYKMWFHGHFPMGYIEPDLSSDGNYVVYKEQLERPVEEIFFADSSDAKGGYLMLMNLNSREETELTDYTVYNPQFSTDGKYVAYQRIDPVTLNHPLMEWINLDSKAKTKVVECDWFFWYH